MSIQMKNLEFSYSDEKTLNGLSAHLKKGEFISILGPNGTGKSTLIKCINGLLKPQKGCLSINGCDISGMKHREIAKIMSYVPQSSSSLFNLSVLDMVLLGRCSHASWRSGKKDCLKAIEALEYLNIESLAMRSFNELSGGQQQKVVIARALAQETEIIVLDEPISNLDIRHQIEVMEIIRELVDKKAITAICIVHDLNIASRYSDKVVIMNKGQAVAEGKPADVLTKEVIGEVYGVEVGMTHVDDGLYIYPLKVKSLKKERSYNEKY